jgi:type II secretion system protein J
MDEKRGADGFTLLEVLIAMFILGLVLAGVYGAYTSNVEAIQVARIAAEVNQTARVVMERMSKDLASSIVETPVQSQAQGITLGMLCITRTVNGRDADEIHFTSLAHVAPGSPGVQTDLCEIGYRLEEAADGRGFILYRRDDPTPDDDIKDGGSSLELARSVVGLKFRFQDPDGQVYDEWNTIEEGRVKVLPALVVMEIAILDQAGGEHRFATSIHPGLAGGGS